MEHWIYFSFTARLTVDSWTPMRSATSARDRGTRWPGPFAEKGLLEFQNTLSARHEGGAALLDGLDHPLGLAHLAGQIVLHLAVVTLLH